MRKFNPKIYVFEKSLMFLWYSTLILGWVGSLKVRFPEMVPLNSVGNQPDSLGRMGSKGTSPGTTWKGGILQPSINFPGALALSFRGRSFCLDTFWPEMPASESTIHGPQSTKKNASSNYYLCCLFKQVVHSFLTRVLVSAGSHPVCEGSSWMLRFAISFQLPLPRRLVAQMPHGFQEESLYTFKVLTFNPFVKTKWQDLRRGDCHRYQDFTGQPNSSTEDRRFGPCDLLAKILHMAEMPWKRPSGKLTLPCKIIHFDGIYQKRLRCSIA